MKLGDNTSEIVINYIRLYHTNSEEQCSQFLRQWLSQEGVTKIGILTTLRFFYQKNKDKDIIKLTKNILTKL